MTRSTLAAALVLMVPAGMMVALAQEAQVPADQQQAAPRTALTAQQLDNLVAPLALYPDPLLSQVLVAATYPLEVVEANQWLQDNRSLTGTALMDAAKQQNWDASVQALVAFPDVLARLNQDVRWTTDLGNAFLGQQKDVMAAVQRLRARAQANGKLTSTPQETVSTANPGRPERDHHSAGRSAGDLCADLRPDLCLGSAGLRLLPSAVLSDLRVRVRLRYPHRRILWRLGWLGRLGLGL